MAGRKRTRKARRRAMGGEVAYYGGRRKRRARRSRKMSGEVAYYGFDGMAGRRRSRRGRRMSGASGGRGLAGLTGQVQNVALAIGGGIAGRLAKNAIPIEDERMKAAIPVLLGIGLSMFGGKNPMMRTAGLGMAAIGGAELLAVLFPNVALLQGEGAPLQVQYTAADVQEALDQGMISQDEASTLLQAAGLMGAIEDFSGQDEDMGPDIPSEATPEAAQEEWVTTENAL